MTGVLLVNLGTPQEPTPEAVGRYLTEFLMDPYVIDIPLWFRWFLVNKIIVPRRKYASAEAYQTVWHENGSPLLSNSRSLLDKTKRALKEDGLGVVLAMRYGQPSLQEGLHELERQKIKDVLVVPLYPQWAKATTVTVLEKLKAEISAHSLCFESLRWMRPFYSHPAFVNAQVHCGQALWQSGSYDAVVFSFHGLPVRQIAKQKEPRPVGCLRMDNCCDNPEPEFCYRSQCFATARAIAEKLKVPKSRYTVAFQSRLGRAKWIEPELTAELEKLLLEGRKRLLVYSPSFVADCLETLEEIEVRAREDFIKLGGEELKLVPSLNSSDIWVEGLKKMILDPNLFANL